MPDRRRSTLAAVLDVFANRAEARRLAREAVAAHQAQSDVPERKANMAVSGTVGWSRASGAKWLGGLSKPLGGRITAHWNLRQQARDIVEDSTHAYALVHRKADTVIDRGLQLKASPIAEVLGITQEEADKWAQDVDRAFDMWASSTSSHRAGMFSFKQAQHQLMIGKTRDNDEFMRLYYPQRKDLIAGLQWEIIDANQIRGDALTATNLMPVKFYDGIDRNPDGSERAYRIWVQPPGNIDSPAPSLAEVIIPKIGEKSGRTMMLHGYQPEYPGQGRGYSQLGVTMQHYELFEDYILSIIKKAINQSQFIGAVENEKQPSGNPLEGLGMPPAGPAPLAAFGATPSAGGISVSGSLESQAPSFVPIEEATFGVPGSAFLTSLAEGDTIKLLQNTVPGTDFEPFAEWYLGSLLAPHGMSLELFKIKFEASYSAARGALAVLWRLVEMERTWWDTWCGAPVYEAWLSTEIAAGRVSCPGWNDPRLRAAWSAHRYIGTPPVQIDPRAEADANMKNLTMSAKTFDDVSYEVGGGNMKANIARNKSYVGDLPVMPWEVKQTAAVAPPGDEDPGTDPKSNGKGTPKQTRTLRPVGAPK